MKPDRIVDSAHREGLYWKSFAYLATLGKRTDTDFNVAAFGALVGTINDKAVAEIQAEAKAAMEAKKNENKA